VSPFYRGQPFSRGRHRRQSMVISLSPTPIFQSHKISKDNGPAGVKNTPVSTDFGQLEWQFIGGNNKCRHPQSKRRGRDSSLGDSGQGRVVINEASKGWCIGTSSSATTRSTSPLRTTVRVSGTWNLYRPSCSATCFSITYSDPPSSDHETFPNNTFLIQRSRELSLLCQPEINGVLPVFFWVFRDFRYS
jgi:hypothetical protein